VNKSGLIYETWKLGNFDSYKPDVEDPSVTCMLQ